MEKIGFGSNDFVDMIMRNAYSGVGSRIVLGACEVIVPAENVSVKMSGDNLFIYCDDLFKAVVDSNKICAVVCEDKI